MLVWLDLEFDAYTLLYVTLIFYYNFSNNDKYNNVGIRYKKAEKRPPSNFVKIKSSVKSNLFNFKLTVGNIVMHERFGKGIVISMEGSGGDKKAEIKFEKKLNSRESFLVAVSGGPDSLALAFLSKCYEEKYGAKFNYCIIDHKLRKDSSKEAQDVCKILKKINIKCKIIKWIGSNPSSYFEAFASVKRYSLLSGECSKLKLNNILLGHHKNDLNENFFIRMTRGSGLKGLVSLDENTKINKKGFCYR